MSNLRSIENLRPLSKRSKEEAREIRSKGGKARAERIKERKTLRDLITSILDEKVTPGSNLTKREALAIKIINNLYNNPDMGDFKKLVEILGELPGQKTTQVTINSNSISASDFLNIKLEE